MEQELWLPVYPELDKKGLFEVSSYGRMRRKGRFLKNGKWKPDVIRKLCLSGRYIRFSISGKTVSVHRIVCTTFHPNPGNKPQVNHKDNNKKNNRADNLEWCTQSENIQHAQSIGVYPYAKPKIKVYKSKEEKKKPQPKKVINTDTGEVYNSTLELSVLIGMKFRTLRRALSGERYNITPYRYFVKGEIINDVRLPPPPLPPKEKPPKKERPPRKVYVPHPAVYRKMVAYDNNGNEVQVFDSSGKAAAFVNTKPRLFRDSIRKSPRSYYKGYIFKYA